ncbi:MAG: hypothetical protein R2695_10630 [Acidimicrobiales bacterium]
MVEKGRLQPGRMFLIDTEQGRIVEITRSRSVSPSARPYGDGWTRTS